MNVKHSLFVLSLLLFVFLVSPTNAQKIWVPFDDAIKAPKSPGVTVLSSDMNGITLKFNIYGMYRTDREFSGSTYHLLNIPSGGHAAEIGRPAVPTVGRFIAVPNGADVSIEILNTKSKILDNYSQVFPAQEPLPDKSGFDESSVQFKKDVQTYNKNHYFPASIAEVETPNYLRGLAVSLIGIFPVRFNPGARQLEVYSEIEIRVNFTGGNGYWIDEKYRSSYFEPLYKNLLVNYDEIGSPPEQTGDVDYLIICHDNYYSNIESFATWKHQKGVSTEIVRVPTDVAANTSDIKAVIQDHYDNDGTSFVLFVGDVNEIPCWYETTHPYHGSLTATDLYYATLSGDDYYPDVYYGRLPIDASSIDIVVNKILNYERNPYVSQTDWYNKPLVAGYFQDDDNDGTADRFFLQTSEIIRDFLGTQGYDNTNYVYTTNSTHENKYYYYGDPITPGLVFVDPGTQEIKDNINAGRFLVQHRDHGLVDGWGDPHFRRSDISDLNNGEMLPVVYSVNCETGWFDYSYGDCFCETFIKKDNGGCVAIIGATRVTYSGYNDELSKGFYDAVWPDFDPSYPTESSTNPMLNSPYYDLGAILNFGKFWMYDKYLLTGGSGYPWTPSESTTQLQFEMYHVMGCPEMSLRTKAPQSLTVNHPSSATSGSLITITVQSEGSPVEGALVCLYKQDEVYERGYTDASGEASFTVEFYSEGDITVTVTGQNYIPYVGAISCSLGPQGTLAGTVTNAISGDPVEATITIKETGRQTTSDPATGYYSMNLDGGTHWAKAEANGYAPDSAEVTIVVDQTTTQDFALDPVDITVTPDSFLVEVVRGDSTTDILTIKNDGRGELSYSISWEYLTEGSDLSQPPNVVQFKLMKQEFPKSIMTESMIDETTESYPGLIKVRQQPDAVWDIHFDYDVQSGPNDNQCLGVEFDGTYFWVTGGGGGGTNKLHKYDKDGNYLTSYDQGTSSDWGWRDLAWDGTYLYASDSYEVAIIDPTTGSKIGSFDGPLDPNRAMAYDPATGHFWTANWNSPIYEFDKDGNSWSYSNTEGYAIYGMAWDDKSEDGPWLWIWSQDGAPLQTCSQYDPINHQFTGVSYQGLGSGKAGGACFTEEWDPAYGIFVGLDQGDPVDNIKGYEVCTLIPPTDFWLSIDPPLTGSLFENESHEKIVHFNTVSDEGDTLDFGDYYAEIKIASNDPDEPELIVPVHLQVVEQNDDYDVSGHVSYGETGPSVSEAVVDLTHIEGTLLDTTDSNGDYFCEDISTGDVTLDPSKEGDQRDAITGSDALFVLQYLAFLTSMNDEQQFAADVTEDGSVTGSDAQAILRYLAFYSDNIGSTGQWRFIPADTSFMLDADAIVDFKAYLLGDANLSWGSSAALAKANVNSQSSLVLADPMKVNANELRIPIVIENNVDGLNTLLLSLEFDSTMLVYKSANLTTLSQQFMMVANGTQGGSVHIAMAGVEEIVGTGAVVNVIFEVINETDHASAQLQLTRAMINDLSPVNLASVSIDFQTLKVGIPKQFDLSQNYPNPFNPETVIEYQLPKEAPVRLRIYNLLGQHIRTLVDDQKVAGYHQIKWDGKDAYGKEVTSGMYIYAIEAGDFRMTKKMVKME